MVKRILLVMICLFVTTTNAEQLLVGVEHSWPPFIGRDLQKEGLATEIVRQAFKTQGYKFQMKWLPWKRAIEGVSELKYDLVPGAWYTDERNKEFYFSDPYLSNRIVFIKRVDDPFEYDGLTSLKGKTIGTIKEYGYLESFMTADTFSRKEARRLYINLLRLSQSKIDLAIEDEIVARSIIREQASSLKDDITYTQNALSTNDLHLIVSRKHPQGKEIIEAFNKGLIAIKDNGAYKKIFEEML
ncbi:substrate-binding periplasmic protein [Hahella ganghwensis]|uniref:substrate-binding periplasmic protein n=1 Tax=Hahella ganghwensis TaxID=286420 RepID=UPI000363D45D|nr:transporter substrate-binding domain-containing protein [Hahella ganghwensis]